MHRERPHAMRIEQPPPALDRHRRQIDGLFPKLAASKASLGEPGDGGIEIQVPAPYGKVQAIVGHLPTSALLDESGATA